MKKINMAGMNILLEKYESGVSTPSGIIISKDSEKIACGKVVQKGPGFLLPFPFESEQDEITALVEGRKVQAKFIPLDIEEGDIVYYTKEAADEVFLENKHYIIIPYLAIKLYLR